MLSPQVAHNVIAEGQLCGVSVCEHGKALLRANLLCANQGPGVCSVDQGDATLVRNVIRGGAEAGEQYSFGRPVQWGCFCSASSDF